MTLVLGYKAVSAAQQAFDGGDHYAGDGMHKEAVVNPVPGEPDHQEQIAGRQDLVCGQTRSRRGNGQ